MKYTKLSLLFAAILLSSCSMNAASAEGEGVSLKVSDMFALVDNNYHRKTEMHLNASSFSEAQSVNKYKGNDFLQVRETIWIDNALYMYNEAGTINSGYYTNKVDEKMHHYRLGDNLDRTNANTPVINDYVASDEDTNTYFANLSHDCSSMHYLHNLDATYVDNLFVKDSFDNTYYTTDSDMIKRFMAIACPCFLNTPLEGEEGAYIAFEKATISYLSNGSLKLSLIVSDEDKDKLDNPSSKIFSVALIDDIGECELPFLSSLIKE